MAKLIGKNNEEIFAGTTDECVKEYYKSHSGEICNVDFNENKSNAKGGFLNLPFDNDEWRKLAITDPNDLRGLFRVYKIALDCEGDWRGKADKRNEDIINDLDMDFDPESINEVLIRAIGEQQALEIAEAMYPNSNNGYTIKEIVSNRAWAYNDKCCPIGSEWAAHLDKTDNKYLNVSLYNI